MSLAGGGEIRAESTVLIIVENQPPTFDSLSTSPDIAEEDQLVDFEGSVSDPEEDSLSLSVEQVGGPDAVAPDASLDASNQINGDFFAPEAQPSDSKLVDFEFTLSDGNSETTKSLSVLVINARADITDICSV